MGADDFYPEERPVHETSVDGFWMDAHAVTVAEFRRFVTETDYITVAERPLDPQTYPVPRSARRKSTATPARCSDARAASQ